MSIQNAITFVKRVSKDTEYRTDLYKLSSKEAILEKLSAEGKSFSLNEFEDAINMLHVKCQTYEEAEIVKQIQWWFEIL